MGMVFMSGNKPKRTPLQQGLRYLFGTAMVALIIYALSQIPYTILREERFRIFGEASVVGVVTAAVEEGSGNESRYFIQYKYVDQDGVPREASAPLPQNVWKKYRMGSRIRVIYAQSHPALARVNHEIEPPFQLWLRDLIN